jgi:hypothetical protein
MRFYSKTSIIFFVILAGALRALCTDITPQFENTQVGVENRTKILTIHDLNNWRDERVGDFLPLNPSTNNYDRSGTYNLGSATYTWDNVYLYRNFYSDKMPFLQAGAGVNAVPSAGTLVTYNWTTESLDNRDMLDTITNNSYVTIPSDGYYYIYLRTMINESVNVDKAVLLYIYQNNTLIEHSRRLASDDGSSFLVDNIYPFTASYQSFNKPTQHLEASVLQYFSAGDKIVCKFTLAGNASIGTMVTLGNNYPSLTNDFREATQLIVYKVF